MVGMVRAILLTTAAAGLAALLTAAGRAGDEKKPLWRPFLPSDDYQELAKRSVDRIHALAKDDSATLALRAEALMLAGYTISAKDAAALAAVRQKAIKIATLADGKETAAEARKLAADLTTAKGDPKSVKETVDWPAAIGNINDVMVPLANKAKGGEGIPDVLQYTPKVKSQNGTEALLVGLASKALKKDVAKMAKELEIVGYRVATIGALTRRRGPHKNKDDAKIWDEQSVIMRDAGVDLAEAAAKKNAADIFAASKRLVDSCVECHANFK
jgi:hypothetical protein